MTNQPTYNAAKNMIELHVAPVSHTCVDAARKLRSKSRLKN